MSTCIAVLGGFVVGCSRCFAECLVLVWCCLVCLCVFAGCERVVRGVTVLLMMLVWYD